MEEIEKLTKHYITIVNNDNHSNLFIEFFTKLLSYEGIVRKEEVVLFLYNFIIANNKNMNNTDISFLSKVVDELIGLGSYATVEWDKDQDDIILDKLNVRADELS